METRLADWIKTTPQGRQADEILRACVHCGFCLATCPTYQLLGDELDSPRGRIYQIKQVLEGAAPTRETQLHLDRCLTCRSCETTCPSGVAYGHLLDTGREVVDARVTRPLGERIGRWLIREGVSRRWLFGTALRIGRALPWAVPGAARAKLARPPDPGTWPTRIHTRKVFLLRGCVQPELAPAIDAATARVLDSVGIQTVVANTAGCCGAIRQHLDDPSGARTNIRRNIEAWWPRIESGEIEAIISNASGCSTQLKEYAALLAEDAQYASRAQHISRMARDLAEFLPPQLDVSQLRLRESAVRRIAFQCPCSLQHGLRLPGAVEKLLTGLGAQLTPVADGHLCCGSAGSYSLLQPALANELRARKVGNLMAGAPQVVLSANIGCISHLQAALGVPIRHWIEWLDEAVAPLDR